MKISLPTVRVWTVLVPVLWVTTRTLAVSMATSSVELGSRWGVQSAVVAQSPLASTFQWMVGVGMVSSLISNRCWKRAKQ